MTLKCSRVLEGAVTRFFRGVGRRISARPWTTIAIALLLAAAFSAGFARLDVENRPDKLWIPQDTDAQDHLEIAEASFGDALRPISFLTTASGGFDSPDAVPATTLSAATSTTAGTSATEGNVLTRSGVLSVLSVFNAIEAVSVTSAVDPDGTAEQAAETAYTLEELCFRPSPSSPCGSVSILDVFGYDAAAINALASDADVVAAVNAAIGPSGAGVVSRLGNPLRVEDVLGGVTYSADGSVVAAQAFKTLVVLDPKDRIVVVDGTERDRPAEDWEDEVSDKVFDEDAFADTDATATAGGTIEHRGQTEQSIGDEFESTITNDSILLSIGIALLITYTTWVFGRFSAVESRVLLSYCAVFSVGLAIASAIGLASLFGLLYSPFHTTLVFLLLGLGVDDAFIIVASYDSTPSRDARSGKLLPVEARVTNAVAYAGSAVLITSVTDAIAFSVGSNTNIPAIRSFALFAAIGVLMDFLFQLTFFVACLTLDARRQRRGRTDFAVCIAAKETPEQAAAREVPTESISRYAIRRYYAPALLSRTGAAVAIGLFLAIGGIAGYGVTELEKDFNIRDFVRDNTRIAEYYDAEEAYFSLDAGVRGAVYFPANFDYVANYDRVSSLPASLEANTWIAEGSTSSWFSGLEESLGGAAAAKAQFTDAAAVVALSKTFLESTDGQRFVSDVVFSADGTSITASRIFYVHVALPTADDKVDAMLAARQVVEDAGLESQGVFAFANPAYLFFEQFRTIDDQARLNIFLTVGAIGVVSFVLIGDPLVSLFVVVLVCWSVLVVFGFGGLWGVKIDAVTVITSVVSLGLLYDSIAHVGHAYVLTSGNRRERSLKSLSVMGAPVLAGATSTFLAVIVTAGSQSFVFRVFFKLLFLAVVSGAFCALVVLPVILWAIGPQSKDGESSDSEIERSYYTMQASSAPWPWRTKPPLTEEARAASTAVPKSSRGPKGVAYRSSGLESSEIDGDDDSYTYSYDDDEDIEGNPAASSSDSNSTDEYTTDGGDEYSYY